MSPRIPQQVDQEPLESPADVVPDSPTTPDSSAPDSVEQLSSPTESDREVVEGEDYQIEQNSQYSQQSSRSSNDHTDREEHPAKKQKMSAESIEPDTTDIKNPYGAGNSEEPQNCKFSGK